MRSAEPSVLSMRDVQYNSKLIGLAGLLQAEVRCALWQDMIAYFSGFGGFAFKTPTLALNITVISDPACLKFSDGIARQTYQNALTPNGSAEVSPLTPCACHGCPGMLLGSLHVGCGTHGIPEVPALAELLDVRLQSDDGERLYSAGGGGDNAGQARMAANKCCAVLGC